MQASTKKSPKMDRERAPAKSRSVASFVVLGASGDLACKKIYPALWSLYKNALIPDECHVVGYARSNLTMDQLKDRFQKHIKLRPEETELFSEFIKRNSYLSGSYEDESAFEKLNSKLEEVKGDPQDNRIFYLALPPSVFMPVSRCLKIFCSSKHGWTRVVLEKPFGKDLQSSAELSQHISRLFCEQQLYRIDHYLGKEMVQSLLVLRFGNRIFSSIWNRDHIQSVVILLKEDIGTAGRAGYYDEYGVIRDIIQNHSLQVLTLVAMEKPCSLTAEDIRNEKLKVLRCTRPVQLDDVVLGQYVGDPEGTGPSRLGYVDDPEVKKTSLTPTFINAVMYVDNERWEGVPFILRAGKALNERKSEVRIQFRDIAGDIFGKKCKRNELVIRLQPGEAIYSRIMTKKPGLTFDPIETELDLTYSERYKNVMVPEAYERLIIDVFEGSQHNFVRSDELAEAWRVVTPLLEEIETKRVTPLPYKFGSRGPPEADQLAIRVGYHYSGTYSWNK